MSYPVVRAKSALTLPRGRDVEREGTVGTVSSVTNVPNLSDSLVSSTYRPNTMFRYRRDYDLMDDYLYDRFYNNPSLYWQDTRFQARRYYNTDPGTDNGMDYPAFWSRYKWQSDFVNPLFWRRHKDPNYDRPLWDSWRPYSMDRSSQKQAIKMFRQGLVDFKTLDRHWIEPSAQRRKAKDHEDVYTPAGTYGPRRYFYSWAA